MVIPTPERDGLLEERLFRFADQLVALHRSNAQLPEQLPFVALTFPWLVDLSTMSQDQRNYQEQRKGEISALGFDGDLAKGQLEETLANDKHLRECCPFPLQLAAYFDSHFLNATALAMLAGASQERLDSAFEEFERTTYHQGRFRRIALSHLFNFDMEGNSIVFKGTPPLGDIKIERINAQAIPSILGEHGVQPFLHTPGIGNCFVVEEEGASDTDDLKWLSEKQLKAYYFGQVLQYFRDGVVHLGYSVPVFFPEWAGEVRRSGLFFLGEFRRLPYENGTKPYLLDATTTEQVRTWWKGATSPAVMEALNNQQGKLRQAIWRAGHYFEWSHRRTDAIDRLISIAIGFESLFSPGDKSELTFRISQTAAQFLGKTSAERTKIFSDLVDMYGRRSKIVHGSYDLDKYLKGEFVTAAELDLWSGYLRRALNGFLALYLRGAKDAKRDPVLDRISELNFDDSKRAALQSNADLAELIKEAAS
jgi:hypothetical protein